MPVNAFKRHRKTLASLTASLFMAVWASMAMVPCLMAAEAAMDGDCQHCPQPPAPCQDDASGCSWAAGYDFDGRQPAPPKLDLKLVALPGGAEPELPAPAAVAFRPVAPRAPPGAAGPRLHLRNCVLTN